MASKWKGDSTHKLPAAQVEPYRLWFEFLKLALTDDSITVDRDYYQPWGDVQNFVFNEWWESHWRQLFAVDVGVFVFDLAEPIEKREGTLIVQILLYQGKNKILKQLEAILDEFNASDRLKDTKHGEFKLDVGMSGGRKIDPATRFLKNIKSVRLLLNIYRFWLLNSHLEDRLRVEAVVRAYFKWASEWNANIRQKAWKRTPIYIPAAITSYVEYLDLRDASGKKRLKVVDDRANERRQIKRYIQKAQKIASNVGEGVFPGSY